METVNKALRAQIPALCPVLFLQKCYNQNRREVKK